jgi:transcriptional regulator with XRE-family HTH domain
VPETSFADGIRTGSASRETKRYLKCYGRYIAYAMILVVIPSTLPAQLVREARRRAELSQAELAARAGTTQSAVARLEAGKAAPRFDRVVDLVAACGLELRVSIREPSRPGPARPPDLQLSLLQPLLDRGVRFVLVSEPAAALRGAPVGDTPTILAVCPDDARANLEALCGALDDLSARIRTPEGTGTLPLDRTPEALLARNRWDLATPSGDLDVVFTPPGTGGYRDLAREATTVVVDGLELPTASLPDVVRELEAANADPDLVHALRRLR